MPRRAPDGKGVTEHRITLGNYERNLITETKKDIEKSVKVTLAATIAVPVIAGVGLAAGMGFLGYGIYRGLDGFSFGVAKKIKEEWEDFKEWVVPGKDIGWDDVTQDAGKDNTWMHWQQRNLWLYSGGRFGHPDWDGLQKAKEDAVTQGGGGGDF